MKKYKYNGKVYCEKDLSTIIENYGGDLFALYFDLKRDGELCENTFYYSPYNPEFSYESYEELIENELSELEVKEND